MPAREAMRPFVINGHGRSSSRRTSSRSWTSRSSRPWSSSKRWSRRDFEAKAPTGTEILDARRVGRVRLARYELLRDLALNLVWVQPLRDDDVREAADPLARRAAPPRRRLPAAPDALGGRRAQGRGRRRGVRAPPADVGRARPRTASSRPALRRLPPQAAPRDRAPADQADRGARSLADPANLTFCLPSHDPDYPTYSYEEILDCTEAVPGARGRCTGWRWCSTTSIRGTARSRGSRRSGKIGDDDFVVAVRAAQPRGARVHPARAGRASGAPAAARRPPRRASRSSRYPPVGRARAVRAACRASSRWRSSRASTSARTRTSIRNAAYSWSPMTADDIEDKTGIESGATRSAASSTSRCRRRTRRWRAPGAGRRRSAR